MKSIERLNKKYFGYFSTFRGKYLLLKEKILTKEEFLLLDFSLATADWDKNHKRTYGLLELNQKEIEWLIGSTAGFVSKHGKKLFKLGFWRKEGSVIRIPLFDRLTDIRHLSKIVRNRGVVNWQKYIENPQLLIEDSQINLIKERREVKAEKIANKQFGYTKSISFPSNDKNDFDEKTDGDWIEKNVHEDENCRP